MCTPELIDEFEVIFIHLGSKNASIEFAHRYRLDEYGRSRRIVRHQHLHLILLCAVFHYFAQGRIIR